MRKRSRKMGIIMSKKLSLIAICLCLLGSGEANAEWNRVKCWMNCGKNKCKDPKQFESCKENCKASAIGECLEIGQSHKNKVLVEKLQNELQVCQRTLQQGAVPKEEKPQQLQRGEVKVLEPKTRGQEQKTIIEQRRPTIKDVSPQVGRKPVITKQPLEIEIYSEEKPAIKKEPPLKTQLKGESKFVGKTLGTKETQPSKTVLPLNYKLLLQLAEDLKKIKNLPNDLRECLQNTKSTAPETILNAIRGFSVKSGGGTQSQNFIVCDEFFVQRYRMNNMEVSDRKAAEEVLDKIKNKPSYNMFVRSYLFTKGSGGNQFRDIGIYPYLKDAKDFSKATPEMFYQLGAAFAQLHKDSLANGKSLSYEDLQPSNFLYTATGEIKFIDYGGLTMEPIGVVYQRIKEFIQTFAHSANEKEQFLLGYESILPNGIPGLRN
jgi:hypothetical protein